MLFWLEGERYEAGEQREAAYGCQVDRNDELDVGGLLATHVDVHEGEHSGKDGHEGHDVAVDALLDSLDLTGLFLHLLEVVLVKGLIAAHSREGIFVVEGALVRRVRRLVKALKDELGNSLLRVEGNDVAGDVCDFEEEACLVTREVARRIKAQPLTKPGILIVALRERSLGRSTASIGATRRSLLD